MASYYEILGVSPHASAAEIRLAYRRAALRWHPDRNRGKEEEATLRFKEIQEAYRTLSQAWRRAQYDRQVARERAHADYDRKHARQAEARRAQEREAQARRAHEAQQRAEKMRQSGIARAQEMAEAGATLSEIEAALRGQGFEAEQVAEIVRNLRIYPWRILAAHPRRWFHWCRSRRRWALLSAGLALLVVTDITWQVASAIFPPEPNFLGEDPSNHGANARLQAAIQQALPSFDSSRRTGRWRADLRQASLALSHLRPEEQDLVAEYVGRVVVDGPTTVYLFNNRPWHCDDCTDVLLSAFATQLQNGQEQLLTPMSVLERRRGNEALKPFALHAESPDVSAFHWDTGPAMPQLHGHAASGTTTGNDRWFRVGSEGINRIPADAIPAIPSCSQPCSHIGVASVEARLLFRPPPEEVAYPREAARAGVTGTVQVRLQINAAGLVTATSVLRASPPGVFEQSAQAYCREFRFMPAAGETTVEQELVYRLE